MSRQPRATSMATRQRPTRATQMQKGGSPVLRKEITAQKPQSATLVASEDISLRRELAAFPPPHILDNLHPDDLASKVFCAIGRCLLSVDNRAMTIKDLADMIAKEGVFTCQNASAAGQAITTFIRTHITRTTAENDYPLLLRHILSGTPSDDDLLPALHSTTGGAHCPVTGNRLTHFRRGTMVWYLSLVTGAPCPFARAGIQLSQYGEGGRIGTESIQREKKRERDRQRKLEQCGQKRKHLARGCTAKESDDSGEDEPPRPSKVKLTLRLKPTATSPQFDSMASPEANDSCHETESDSESSGDESMSVDSEDSDSDTDPSPPGTPALPPYPWRGVSIPSYVPSLGDHHQSNAFSQCNSYENMTNIPVRHRSPSVPYSIASPPPDSEEEDDFHIKMAASRYSVPSGSGYGADGDWDDIDSGGEAGSPGPSSPEAGPSCYPEVAVKQEPDVVGQTLDEWEHGILDNEVKVKIEPFDSWQFDSFHVHNDHWLEEHQIKQEELDFTTNLFAPSESVSIPSARNLPLSPLSSVSSDSSFQDEHDHGMGDFAALSMDDFHWNDTAKPARSRAHTRHPLSGHPTRLFSQPPRSHTLTRERLVHKPCSKLTEAKRFAPLHACAPEIRALEIEGIPVYQIIVGGLTSVLRRIDTDFVHLTPIIKLVGLVTPPLANAVIVGGSREVAGAWTPLASAQEFIQQHPLPNGVLDVFLSPTLFELFPAESMRLSAHGQPFNHFGPHFASNQPVLLPSAVLTWDNLWTEDIVTSTQASFPPNVQQSTADEEPPLSPLEQEMFSAFCILPDQDKEDTPSAVIREQITADDAVKEQPAPTLRRSTRNRAAATAIAPTPAPPARSRARSVRTK